MKTNPRRFKGFDCLKELRQRNEEDLRMTEKEEKWRVKCE